MDKTRAPGASPTAVRLTAVRRLYRDAARQEVAALAGVDLAVRAGTFVAVMGPSGSGKSTLLQCAAGLDRPTSGSVEVGGTELTGLSERRLTLLRRDLIGFVFQAFNLIPSLTAAQNVALPLRLAGRRPSRTEVRDALARVGLADRARHRPGELSGGQQQRVALARALVSHPAVLFGDEPTGALDTGTSRQVLALLRGLVDGEGQTTVMVTHDPVAASYADRVVFLVDGLVASELHAPGAGAVAERMAELESGALRGGAGARAADTTDSGTAAGAGIATRTAANAEVTA
ncbi:ABC transporter ATP-binding protein [Streptomyces alfalfae]|uniref:ABC transporter n=1 Tax=Streptomyces alfalfae TaxID=1642299 RepID=A0ABN4VIY7_9ACTN|nr:ABC transporter ATP-binding protein [Streptomyces alfalfae]AYA17508.1 ABC transporter ATP-binding protein [Streptomyces fradiae]APY87109.1 ABC transporter [Streptomyces alfalfae]QUI33107.1 ABC transporter ATP-binding protein [Streptomyces alfalfae]RXX44566.1 ABC transporter ATP-binding protein [Streptomyces alfalfae]RZN05342.1 ABC transporter ATP-binding protein [Streptomyces alfalfae]